MKEAHEFLRKCGTFFLATDDDGQPRVRPFGALSDFEGKLYLETNNQKKVYQQLTKNGKAEICGMHEGKKYKPEEARQIIKKLEIHYTPKHGSWLDIAEIE